jgi:exodeoxyribonuclease V alpha subunit
VAPVSQITPSPSAPSSAAPPREHLAGLIERVTFHSIDSGFCVLRVKVRGKRDLVTVVGHAALVSAGEAVQASGTWINDRDHGLQFKADFLKCSMPTTIEGIETYLGSGMIKGVGPVYAKKLVRAFADAVFDIIEQAPDRLREVAGIGPKRAERIIAGWAEQKAVREIMLYLHSHGVSTARAVRIYKTYGPDAVQVITEDPYRLARDIHGIGFKTADHIASRLGFEKTAPVRLHAGIGYALSTAMEQGHCGLPTDELIELATQLLEAPRPLVEAALDGELMTGDVIADSVDGTGCVFLTRLYKAEKAIADRLKRLGEGRLPWGTIDVDSAIPWVEASTGLTLAASQREALRQALASKLLVITGGPGVGKTTLVNSILQVLAAKDVRILLGAPTGRAAKRMTETTGLEARTLHRLLEIDPTNGGFKRGPDNPLDCDLLVMDESSMVDVMLMHALLKAVPPHAALLLVGDVDQLPSVGPGQVLADIIASGAVPVVRLTEVFRQAASSRIITNAHRINRGEMPDLSPDPTSDFQFVEANEPEEVVGRLVQVVARHLPRRLGYDPLRDVQVLCPLNRGGLGARTLNVELQAVLNPPGADRVDRFGWSFSPGDRVMQVVNDYDKDVYNGDLGLIASVDHGERELVVDFDGREVTYDFGELDALALAYATTVHKAQGSEYPVVVMVLSTKHYAMLERRPVYTGLTRGKKLVVVIGSRKALWIAIKGKAASRRWSRLNEWLAA